MTETNVLQLDGNNLVHVETGQVVEPGSKIAEDLFGPSIRRHAEAIEREKDRMVRSSQLYRKRVEKAVASQMKDASDRLFNITEFTAARSVLKVGSPGVLDVADASGHVSIPIGDGVDPSDLVDLPIGARVRLHVECTVIGNGPIAKKGPIVLVNTLEPRAVRVIDVDLESERDRREG